MFCSSFFVHLVFFFWPLYCLSFGHCIVCRWPLYCMSLTTVLAVVGHCIVCLLATVLSVFWPLYCLSLATVLSVVGHCIVCRWPLLSVFWPLHCLSLATVLSVVGHCIVCRWPLYCLLLATVLYVVGQCIDNIYGFWCRVLYLQTFLTICRAKNNCAVFMLVFKALMGSLNEIFSNQSGYLLSISYFMVTCVNKNENLDNQQQQINKQTENVS